MELQFKTYTRTKTVKAMPMGAGDARHYGANITEETIHKNLGNNGYLVEYSNGYRSWCPAMEFEASHSLSEDYIDKMNVDLSGLVDRIVELEKETYLCLCRDDEDRAMLLAQVQAMREYAEILNVRLRKEVGKTRERSAS